MEHFNDHNNMLLKLGLFTSVKNYTIFGDQIQNLPPIFQQDQRKDFAKYNLRK